MANPPAEQALIERLQAGETVVVNMRKQGHPRVIAWANARGLLVRIDRKSPWGNDFKEGVDGNLQEVIAMYAASLSGRPDLLKDLPTLRGKALMCWCAPKPCHGDALIQRLKELESGT